MKKLANVFNTFYTLYFQSRSLRRTYGRAKSLEIFLAGLHLPPRLEGQISVDLGCGPSPKNPFNASTLIGVDIRQGLDSSVIPCDLCFDGIPLETSSVDFCTAFDFIEHIPRFVRTGDVSRYLFVEMMDEVFRVLKPGGLFLSSTPAFPSRQAFQDPTHVNIITEETFPLYFSSEAHPDGGLFARMYGFKGDFSLLGQAWIHDAWLATVMAVKK